MRERLHYILLNKPVLQIFLHHSHPSPVVDDDEDDGDEGDDENRDGDDGGVARLVRVDVRVGRESDGGVQDLDATMLTRRTDTASHLVTGVEIIGTLAVTIVQGRGVASLVLQTKGTVLMTVLTKPVALTVAPAVQVRAELCSLLVTLTVTAAQGSVCTLRTGGTLASDVMTGQARLTVTGLTAV